MSIKSCFRGPFDKKHSKQAETLFISKRQNFYHIYWSLRRKFSLKKSLWVICKILRLFVNPLTVDYKYSLLKRGNLFQHFQMQLSQKREIFSQSFSAFSKFRLNFEHFQKKDDPHLIPDVLLNLLTPKNVVSKISKKSCFRGPFGK